MSRFTAGEDLIAIPTDIASIAAVEKDDDDDIDDKFPIMLTFLGLLIIIIVTSAVLERTYHKPDIQHGKVTSLDPLVESENDRPSMVVAIGSRGQEDLFSPSAENSHSKMIPQDPESSKEGSDSLNNSKTKIRPDV